MIMKKFLLATAAVMALATSASAADLPRKSVAPVIAVPLFTWTGFYVGVNAGYAFTDFKRSAVGGSGLPGVLPGLTTTSGTRTVSADGFTGGVQVGYNYQINSIVVGLEGDFNFVDTKKSINPEVTIPNSLVLSSTSKLEWLATVRGRLGVTFDRFLIYGTGGVAFGSVKVSDQFDFRPAGAPGLGLAGSSSSSRTGYVIGAGVEYAFTNNISAKVEYLFADLGKTSYVHGIVPGTPNSGATLTNKTTTSIVRAGVNYRF
jgi:outer membrane immunogenic protein